MAHYKQYITERADDLKQGRLGRKLADTTVIPRPFAHYAGQLRPGEQLYMLLSGGYVPPRIAVWVTSQSEYEEFYRQYYSGRFTGIDLYAVPNRDAQE